MTSGPFEPLLWRTVDGFEFTDLTYHRHRVDGQDQPTVRIAFDRPEVRNAFRPHTVDELYRALDHARMSADVGCVLLTGNGPSPRDGGWAFCSGGDQRIRDRDGYRYAAGDTRDGRPCAAGRLHILEVQRLIRFMPKVVICVVPGWAAGGAQPARGVRSHHRERRTRPVQADRRRRRLVRRRIRLGISGPPGRAEVRSADFLSRGGVHGRRGAADGHGERRRPARLIEQVALEWATRSTPRARRPSEC